MSSIESWYAACIRGPINPYSQSRKLSEENYIINGLYERANVIDNRKLLNLGIRN